ncbi:MAG: DUF1064 domain-containing protein [Paludibacteraceae bacterium]|nr:DUF1064 domain-containing protein [Paludibacteraceae bacterium]
MKYRNKKVMIDGVVFDSIKEGNRYTELKLLERAGYISDLKRQVKYILIPSQKDEKGRVIEREVSYKADFVYRDNETGKTVVEDVKGFRTKEYILKRKMMLYFKGIRIMEV